LGYRELAELNWELAEASLAECERYLHECVEKLEAALALVEQLRLEKPDR